MTAETSAPLTVAIVNDHELIVRGIAAMLEPFSDVVEVVELDVEVPVLRPVDIALYDTFTRTGFTGEDLDRLCANPAIGRVVLFTWFLSEELVESARSRGVAAAIPKSLDGAELVRALTTAHQGRLEIIPFVEDPTIATNSWPGREHGLTPPRVRDHRARHHGPQQPVHRRTDLPQHQLGEVLHPLGLSDHGRDQSQPSSAVGDRPRDGSHP